MPRKRHRRRRNSSAATDAALGVPALLPPPTVPLPLNQQQEQADEDQSNAAIRTISLGEIWAFPLESDGCPRSYARVDRILPFPLPSLLRVTPLLLHPVTDEDFLCSENSLPVPCGVFRPSADAPLLKPVPAFSHRVPTLPDPSGAEFYRIFPARGEVWAVYARYVDPKAGFEYRLVEVVSRFDDEKGVDVAALVEVGREGEEEEEMGAKVYRRQLVQERIERKAMFVFSHRVVATRIVRDGKNFWKLVAVHLCSWSSMSEWRSAAPEWQEEVKESPSKFNK